MTRLVSVALVFVLVVAACGDDDAGDGGSAPLTATTSTQAPTTTSATTSTTAPQDDVVVADGDFVEVHYRGTLDDGTEFDSSAGRAPLGFVVGSGQVIPGFDDAVRGLEVGDEITVRIEAVDAYGEPQDDLIFDLSTEGAPEGLAVGDEVTLTNGRRVTILAIDTETNTATVDGNHELAGEALTFEIEVVSVERP